jgi:hypothetical protein
MGGGAGDGVPILKEEGSNMLDFLDLIEKKLPVGTFWAAKGRNNIFLKIPHIFGTPPL